MRESVPLLVNGELEAAERVRQQQYALSRWDGEGGAGPQGPQDGSTAVDERTEVLLADDADLAELRIRVAALEILLIALHAEACHRQHERAHEIGTWISPGTDPAHRPSMIRCAAEVIDLAGHFGLFPADSDS